MVKMLGYGDGGIRTQKWFGWDVGNEGFTVEVVFYWHPIRGKYIVALERMVI